MANQNIYPWQESQWQQLCARKQQKRLPHALLFAGLRGLGKRDFALAFARGMLCSQPNPSGEACEQCHACHLLRAQSHPDLLLVEPEQAGQMIKIDQIRETVQFVYETAMQGIYRVVIINPANAMNIAAANALLKTLEEPAPNTILILISDVNLRLPATIMSRCQKILFTKPTQDVALQWLQTQTLETTVDHRLLLNLASGAPLKAKEIVAQGLLTLRQELYQSLQLLSQRKTDPLQLAAQYYEQDMQILLNLLLVWLQDLLRFKLVNEQVELINCDYQAVFTQLAPTWSQANLLKYIDQVKKAYFSIVSSLNLNRQLMLEELFIRWAQYATG